MGGIPCMNRGTLREQSINQVDTADRSGEKERGRVCCRTRHHRHSCRKRFLLNAHYNRFHLAVGLSRLLRRHSSGAPEWKQNPVKSSRRRRHRRLALPRRKRQFRDQSIVECSPRCVQVVNYSVH
jgi:hypothetical protein